MTPGQLKKLVQHIDKIRSFEPDKIDDKTQAWLDKRTKDEKYMAAARKRLVEYGIAEERLAKFPADQVVLLDEKREYEVQRDDAIKLLNLPTWEALACLDKLPKAEPGLFTGFNAAFQKVRQAQGRLEQRIALLRHVEAIRLFAADHDGKLPAKLADVSVPLPDDPFTGKPFAYRVDGDTAHLRGSPPAGDEKSAAYNVRYEVTIRR